VRTWDFCRECLMLARILSPTLTPLQDFLERHYEHPSRLPCRGSLVPDWISRMHFYWLLCFLLLLWLGREKMLQSKLIKHGRYSFQRVSRQVGDGKVANGSQTGRDALQGESRTGHLKSSYERAASVAHLLATAVVLATASYLHDARLLSILAVFAAILTAFLATTIARRVRTLVFILFLSHVNYSLIRYVVFQSPSILELPHFVVKQEQ